FDSCDLDRPMKSVILLGQNGRVFSAAHIWEVVGIVDTEDYRKLVESLLTRGILVNAVERLAAKRAARREKIPFKEYPRYKIVIPAQAAESLDKTSEVECSSKIKAQARQDAALASESDDARIFIANLPIDAQASELYEIFSSYGSIKELRIPRYAKN